MVRQMLICEQTSGLSVWGHGLAVKEHTQSLIDELKGNYPLGEGWRLPSWFVDNKEFIKTNLHEEQTIQLYTQCHDCGKILCRTIDETGKIHFPNHAQFSKDLFLSLTGNKEVSDLIGWDMVLHSSTAEEIESFCHIWTVKDAITLLIVGLAELHANSKMFGGIDSISFKSKWKNLERRGKQVLRFFQCNKTI
jgi:hypothetical protein